MVGAVVGAEPEVYSGSDPAEGAGCAAPESDEELDFSGPAAGLHGDSLEAIFQSGMISGSASGHLGPNGASALALTLRHMARTERAERKGTSSPRQR